MLSNERDNLRKDLPADYMFIDFTLALIMNSR